MACRTGLDLLGGDVLGDEAIGIFVGLKISLDHPKFERSHISQRFQQRGLARSRAGHQIDPQYVVPVKVRPVVIGFVIVFVEDLFDHRNGFGIVELRVVVEIFVCLLMLMAVMVVIMVVMVVMVVIVVMIVGVCMGMNRVGSPNAASAF
jgi:hypothetical protein